jgi:D-glycerate 3-kinase
MDASTPHSQELLDQLNRTLAAERLPASYRDFIAAVHVPLVARIVERASANQSTLLVGICGAQGSGKSTLAATLAVLLRARGLNTAILSLDDLYLTRAERTDLATLMHPLLQTRGVPGTHDVALGLEVLRSLERDGATAIPSFDKASDDRREPAAWPRIQAPCDVVLFEGWCVGARAQDASELDTPINELEAQQDADGRWRRFVNEQLASHYQQLFGRVDLLVLMQAPSFSVVHRWRLEQERRLQERCGTDATRRYMDADQIHRFIQHYERLTRHILTEMPTRADVCIKLDAERRAMQISFNPAADRTA